MTVVFTKAPFEDNYDLTQWPIWHARYLNIYKAIKMGNPVVNQIIKHAPYVGGRKSVLIDVRMQYLEPTGYFTTKHLWHVDTPRDPDSMHHIYMLGTSRTEFEMETGDIKTLPHGYYATYSSSDWHRGGNIIEEEYRLFIRIQESNQDGLENLRGLHTYYPARHLADGTIEYEDEDVVYNRLQEKLPTLNRGKDWKPTTQE